MNILSLFVLVPLLMLLGLWIARGSCRIPHRFLYRTPQRRRYRRNAFH